MDFKRRELSDYCIVGNVSLERVESFHDLVMDFRERFLEDHALQDVLLNGGYELDKSERPTSFYNFQSVINGMKVCINLMFLEYVIDVATRPRLDIIKSPLIIIPGEEEPTRLVTPEGFDSEGVDQLQTDWMREHTVVEIIRKYQRTLTEALGEYSAQFILGRISYARSISIPSPHWKEGVSIVESINKVFDPKSFNSLDTAYYSMGNLFFRSASTPYQKLSQDDFGKEFILSQEEVVKGLRTYQRPPLVAE